MDHVFVVENTKTLLCKMQMLVLQGEWEYDRYMLKILWKLKEPHATRASCYITHPLIHMDCEGSTSLNKGLGRLWTESP